jgi:hypothetical protein
VQLRYSQKLIKRLLKILFTVEHFGTESWRITKDRHQGSVPLQHPETWRHLPNEWVDVEGSSNKEPEESTKMGHYRKPDRHERVPTPAHKRRGLPPSHRAKMSHRRRSTKTRGQRGPHLGSVGGWHQRATTRESRTRRGSSSRKSRSKPANREEINQNSHQ